jgi:hypothetical protein
MNRNAECGCRQLMMSPTDLQTHTRCPLKYRVAGRDTELGESSQVGQGDPVYFEPKPNFMKISVF